jgi:hypothetical protein
MAVRDIGEICVDCRKSVAIGSGRFVNRYPVHTDEEDGFRCFECDEEIMKDCYVICTSCETDYGKGNTVCPHCGHHERRPYES